MRDLGLFGRRVSCRHGERRPRRWRARRAECRRSCAIGHRHDTDRAAAYRFSVLCAALSAISAACALALVSVPSSAWASMIRMSPLLGSMLERLARAARSPRPAGRLRAAPGPSAPRNRDPSAGRGSACRSPDRVARIAGAEHRDGARIAAGQALVGLADSAGTRSAAAQRKPMSFACISSWRSMTSGVSGVSK